MSRELRVRELLTERFRPVHLTLENESHAHSVAPGSETHFKLVMASAAFEGLGRLERQRAVLALLQGELASGLHALTMRLFSPGEWETAKADFEMESPPCHGGSKHDR